MAFVPAPNIVQVEIRAILEDQHVENRLMVDCLHEPTITDLTTLSALFGGWIADSYAPLLAGDVHFSQIVLTDMGSEEGIQLTNPLSDVGSAGGASRPNQESVCVSFRTGNRGRSARGRWYMLPTGNDNIAPPNSITTLFATSILGAFSGLLADIRDADYVPVIVSYVSDGDPRPGGPVYFPITSASLTDLLLDSQRRRKPGNGS